MRTTLKTFNSASLEEVTAANLATIANIKARMAAPPPRGCICPAGWLVEWGQAELMAQLGIQAIVERTPENADIPALFAYPSGKDKVEYVATNNSTNRKLDDVNWKYLFRVALSGRFVITGEALIFDSEGMAASAQHRIVACFVATVVNPDLKFYFILQEGIDPLCVDCIDTGKSRTTKDIGGRHKDGYFPADMLRTLQGLPYGKDRDKVREQMIRDSVGALSVVYHRANSQDVNSSTTNYSKDKSLFDAMVSRFQMLSIANHTGEATEQLEVTSLERLTNLVYAFDSENGGNIRKYWGRSNMVAILILASNVNNPSELEPVLDSRNGKATGAVSATLPEVLDVDLQLAEHLLRVACDKVGPFAPLYSYLESRKGKNALDKQYKFGGLVNAVKYFIENQSSQTYPAVHNEAGEVVSPERVVVTCPPLPSNGIPATPKTKADGTKAKFKWPAFGGLDVGPVDGKALHNTQVLEEAASEESEASDE